MPFLKAPLLALCGVAAANSALLCRHLVKGRAIALSVGVLFTIDFLMLIYQDTVIICYLMFATEQFNRGENVS